MTSHRLYYCCRCHKQVIICTKCDRGNRYCEKACSTQARRESQRRAGKKYQSTEKGRRRHAKRQWSYQARKKMTHHSSASESPSLESTVEEKPDTGRKVASRAFTGSCSFCGCQARSLRRHFLKTMNYQERVTIFTSQAS